MQKQKAELEILTQLSIALNKGTIFVKKCWYQQN